MTGRLIQQERWRTDWPICERMAAEGYTLEQIVEAIPGRTIDQVRWKFLKEGKPVPLRNPEAKQGVRKEYRKRGPAPGTPYKLSMHQVQSAITRISAEQAADRDARYAAAARRTPTQEFFGDPPPGFSHLDKVRSVASASHPNQNNETQ